MRLPAWGAVRLEVEIAAVARQLFNQVIDCCLHGSTLLIASRAKVGATAPTLNDPIPRIAKRLQELLLIMKSEVGTARSSHTQPVTVVFWNK